MVRRSTCTLFAASLVLLGAVGCSADRSTAATADGEPTTAPAPVASSTSSDLVSTTVTDDTDTTVSGADPQGVGDGWSAYGVLGHPWASDVEDVAFAMPDAIREDMTRCGIPFSSLRAPGVTLLFNAIDGFYRFQVNDDSLPSDVRGVRLGMPFRDIKAAFPSVSVVSQGSAPEAFWWEAPGDPSLGAGSVSGSLLGRSDSSLTIGVITGTMPGYFEKCAT